MGVGRPPALNDGSLEEACCVWCTDEEFNELCAGALSCYSDLAGVSAEGSYIGLDPLEGRYDIRESEIALRELAGGRC